MLNARLSWLEHTSYVRNKIAKNIRIIIKVRHILSPSTLKTLYTSFVYPYLTCCIEVWGSAPRSYIDPIIKLQKKVLPHPRQIGTPNSISSSVSTTENPSSS
jgi:hypothetical protein